MAIKANPIVILEVIPLCYVNNTIYFNTHTQHTMFMILYLLEATSYGLVDHHKAHFTKSLGFGSYQHLMNVDWDPMK